MGVVWDIIILFFGVIMNMYKEDIEEAIKPRLPLLAGIVTEINDRMMQTKTQNLEGNQRIEYEDIKADINNVMAVATPEFEAATQQVKTQASELEQKAKQGLMIFVIGIAISVLLLFIAISAGSGTMGFICFIVFAVTYGIRFFMNRSCEKQAEEINNMVNAVMLKWVSYCGDSDVVLGTTGLFKRVDDLYLASLESMERGFTLQNRQMQKQMLQMQNAHSEQMNMMAAQTQVLQSELRNLANK